MFNTKTYDSTNNNYNANFDMYIIGNNNVPVDGVKYYSNKFGQVMTSFIVDPVDPDNKLEDGVIKLPGT